MTYFRWLYLVPLLTACTDTNDIVVRLAPDVISSIDGRLAVHAIVLRDREPAESEAIQITVEYTDRNGTAHAIAPVDGTTDQNGAFETELKGLLWDGAGAVTATVMAGSVPVMVDNAPLASVATFAVLDRTPPKTTIIPPANNTVSQNNGTTVQVHATDEIGVSQIMFEWGDFRGRDRSLITSGATDVTVTFDVDPGNFAVGTTLTLYALAEDLSGNQGVAMPITVTVAP